jgi:hypothetical protein
MYTVTGQPTDVIEVSLIIQISIHGFKLKDVAMMIKH